MENMKDITMKQACVIEYDSRFVQLAVLSKSEKEKRSSFLGTFFCFSAPNPYGDM